MTWHSEKILSSSRCVCGFMASSDQKSWMVSSVCFLFLLLLHYLTGIPIAIKENTPMAWGYQNYEVSGLLKLTFLQESYHKSTYNIRSTIYTCM